MLMGLHGSFTSMVSIIFHPVSLPFYYFSRRYCWRSSPYVKGSKATLWCCIGLSFHLDFFTWQRMRYCHFTRRRLCQFASSWAMTITESFIMLGLFQES